MASEQAEWQKLYYLGTTIKILFKTTVITTDGIPHKHFKICLFKVLDVVKNYFAVFYSFINICIYKRQRLLAIEPLFSCYNKTLLNFFLIDVIDMVVHV